MDLYQKFNDPFGYHFKDFEQGAWISHSHSHIQIERKRKCVTFTDLCKGLYVSCDLKVVRKLAESQITGCIISCGLTLEIQKLS
jgi:hypothetical protein